MGIIKTITKTIIKTVTAVILIAMLAISATSVSLIYDFRKPKPFEGPDIFNPYRNLDTAYCWKRANFHTHTRVDGLMNECEKWPGEVYADLEKFGYEIITFSNHNRLTAHPFGGFCMIRQIPAPFLLPGKADFRKRRKAVVRHGNFIVNGEIALRGQGIGKDDMACALFFIRTCGQVRRFHFHTRTRHNVTKRLFTR